jgi:tetratricopeptide (TPR) repeat protein
MTDADQHQAVNTNGNTEGRQQSETTNNTTNADAVTALVQAGSITGGVHQHLPAPRPPVPTPRQLLAPPAGFVGRDSQLALLDHALTSPDDSVAGNRGQDGPTAVISAIGGTGGIGKTWLALTWAHRNLHRFPDGQLAVDLRGFSPGEPRHPTDVLADFLAALGVDRDQQPADLDARIALYRTHTTGKRLLILLDNAASTDQVDPLLPGGDTCTVLVTSRDHLPALLARRGARAVGLDVLTDIEARSLLHVALGESHPGKNSERAVAELIGLCKGFPLALGLIAARFRSNPDLLHDFVAELRDLGLEALESDDPAASLPTVLSWSLRNLSKQQRTVFGLLGIAPGSGATLPAMVALTGMPPAGAHRAVPALEGASLLERRQGGRYVMHDLVRDYAAATARANLSEDMRETALTRVMGFYLQTALVAQRVLDPHGSPRQVDPPGANARMDPMSDVAAAMGWMETEHATLLAIQRAVATLGRHHLVWHLAWNLDTFHRRGDQCETLAVWGAALEATAHLSDPVTRIRAHRFLGNVCSWLGRHEEATRHLDRALDLAVRHEDPAEQAHTHRMLALAWGRRGDGRRALEHARHARDLYRTLEGPVWEADALNLMGLCAARLGEFDTASEHCRAALALHRHHHYLDGEAATRGSLGFIAHRAGDHQRAVDQYHQALTLYRTLGNTYGAAGTLDDVGHPHVALGQRDQARLVWREALVLFQQQGRSAGAERVQRQLDELDTPSGTAVGLANVDVAVPDKEMQ